MHFTNFAFLSAVTDFNTRIDQFLNATVFTSKIFYCNTQVPSRHTIYKLYLHLLIDLTCYLNKRSSQHWSIVIWFISLSIFTLVVYCFSISYGNSWSQITRSLHIVINNQWLKRPLNLIFWSYVQLIFDIFSEDGWCHLVTNITECRNVAKCRNI